MVTPAWNRFIAVLPAIAMVTVANAQDAGSIRGFVNDRDFEAPVSDVQVEVLGERLRTTTGPRGDYRFEGIKPGVYTLVFRKDGYQRQIRSQVRVESGQIAEEDDVYLNGDFADLEDFIVEEVELDTGTESGLLKLRLDSPSLLDAISAELMSQAGASDGVRP